MDNDEIGDVMIDINIWMKSYLENLTTIFGQRLYFVGLQGSYGRGEATKTSDIDVVVILDKLAAADITAYSDMLDTLPNRKLICGFISGKEELINWEPSDLFQFYYDTTPIFGTLDEIRTKIDRAAVERAIKMGACNIYHGCVHNMIIDKEEDILRGLYKSAAFIIQAIVFCESGRYVKYQNELLEVVKNRDKEILETAISLKNGNPAERHLMSERLFKWASILITQNNSEK